MKILFALLLCAGLMSGMSLADTPAHRLLSRAVEAHTLDESSLPHFQMKQAGQWHILGHYAAPWQQRTVWIEDSIVVWLDARAIFCERTVDSSRSEQYLVLIDSTVRYFEREDSTGSWEAGSVENGRTYAMLLLARIPELIVTIAASAPDLAPDGHEQSVSFTLDGYPWEICFDSTDGRVRQTSFVHPDELYGDVEEVFQFADYSNEKASVPGVTISHTALDLTMQDLVTMTEMTPADPMPSEWLENVPEPEARPVEATFRTTDSGLHEIILPDLDTRILIVEFRESLFVLEAAESSAYGEKILELLAEQFPDKPVKHVGVSHHHPHYTSGLRPFIHAGAILNCSGNIAEYLRTCLSRPRTINPDALSREPKEIVIEGAGNRGWYSDGDNEIEFFEIGMHSNHTDNFLLFYHPPTGIAFGGDLLWISEQPDNRPLSKRTTGLHAAIKELDLDVKRVLTSWPVGGDWGYKDQVSWEELDSAVTAEVTE